MEVQETWRPVPGFPRYIVSDQGRVARVLDGNALRTDWSGRDHAPYRAVRLYDENGTRRKLLLHRLVYLAFHGPVPPGCHVDHIDRDRENNRLSNLRCVSVVENMANRRRPVSKEAA